MTQEGEKNKDSDNFGESNNGDANMVRGFSLIRSLFDKDVTWGEERAGGHDDLFAKGQGGITGGCQHPNLYEVSSQQRCPARKK